MPNESPSITKNIIEIKNIKSPIRYYTYLTLVLLSCIVFDCVTKSFHSNIISIREILLWSLLPLFALFIVMLLLIILPIQFYFVMAIIGPFGYFTLYFMIKNGFLKMSLIILSLQCFSALRCLSNRIYHLKQIHLIIFRSVSLNILKNIPSIILVSVPATFFFQIYFNLIVNFLCTKKHRFIQLIQICLVISHVEHTIGLLIIFSRTYISRTFLKRSLSKAKGAPALNIFQKLKGLYRNLTSFKEILRHLIMLNYLLYHGTLCTWTSCCMFWRFCFKYSPVGILKEGILFRIFYMIINNPRLFYFIGYSSFEEIFYSFTCLNAQISKRVMSKMMIKAPYLSTCKYSVIALLHLIIFLFQIIVTIVIEFMTINIKFIWFALAIYIVIVLYFILWLVFNIFDTIYKSYILLYIWDSDVLTKNGIDVEELENTF